MCRVHTGLLGDADGEREFLSFSGVLRNQSSLRGSVDEYALLGKPCAACGTTGEAGGCCLRLVHARRLESMLDSVAVLVDWLFIDANGDEAAALNGIDLNKVLPPPPPRPRTPLRLLPCSVSPTVCLAYG